MGSGIDFWTNYTERGTVDDVATRIHAGGWVLAAYAARVRYNATENDSDGAIWTRLVDFVSANESRFFTKSGDWRRRHLVSNDELLNVLNGD